MTEAFRRIDANLYFADGRYRVHVKHQGNQVLEYFRDEASARARLKAIRRDIPARIVNGILRQPLKCRSSIRTGVIRRVAFDKRRDAAYRLN